MATGTAAERGARSLPAVRTRVGPIYAIGWLLANLTCRVIFRARLVGHREVPAGPVVLVGNHRSYLDIFLIGCGLRRHVAYVARHTLADNSFLDWFMGRTGAILVRRGTPDRAALLELEAHLRGGDTVAVFPEGRRSRDGSLLPFKGGAALAARRCHAPIVPVALVGTDEAAPAGGRIRFCRVQAIYGEPIDSRRKDALELARAEVARLLTEAGAPPVGYELESGTAPTSAAPGA